MSKLLEIKDLCVDYITAAGDVRAVNHVNFSIDKGEIFGLAGESGCGKSTVAFSISRLLKPPAIISEGQILFEGRDVVKFSEEELRRYRWNDVSVVFQSAMNSLNPVLRVEDQLLDVMLTHLDITKDEALDRAAELFRTVGIHPDRLKDYPHQFSGGMRQRIVIAIALALNPKMIIMDEPTTALDVVVQREILQEIYELKQKFGFSILFITHDLSLMVEFTDRIGIMYAGELIEVAPSKEILSLPKHPYAVGLANSFPSMHGPVERMEGIPGNPLNLLQVPPGCRFQSRCNMIMDDCKRIKPEFVEKSPNHWSACHHKTL